MAGVKGKSGGPRPNSGGKRPGAGRKPKIKAPESANVAVPANGQAAEDIGGMNMLEMLQAVALGKVQASPLQVRAAIAAVQYTHTKRHDGGKRDEQADRSKKAASGRFAAAAPPKLIVNNG